jgi:hypothetical protein
LVTTLWLLFFTHGLLLKIGTSVPVVKSLDKLAILEKTKDSGTSVSPRTPYLLQSNAAFSFT